ncbi:hypothetical protein ZIOFF_042769 [Zingiber officinale]|uniref:Uncharacterized protein n=1 Tax=Zingiber officinale TaxID=94328 RepID=A0A8J5KVS1_ZINOF|nr:hypothetical protein ZIOFF_042769 [Zingiber officinale]
MSENQTCSTAKDVELGIHHSLSPIGGRKTENATRAKPKTRSERREADPPKAAVAVGAATTQRPEKTTTATMAFVIVISLPFILFTILLAFACYFLGRAKGRKDVRNGIGSQVYGVPLPPPGAESGSSLSAPPPRLNKQGLEDV